MLPTLAQFAGERENWRPGHERYDAALRELAAKVCREEECTVQDLVFKLKVLRAAKAKESGDAATKILRRIIRLRWYAQHHASCRTWAASCLACFVAIPLSRDACPLGHVHACSSNRHACLLPSVHVPR